MALAFSNMYIYCCCGSTTALFACFEFELTIEDFMSLSLKMYRGNACSKQHPQNFCLIFHLSSLYLNCTKFGQMLMGMNCIIS